MPRIPSLTYSLLEDGNLSSYCLSETNPIEPRKFYARYTANQVGLPLPDADCVRGNSLTNPFYTVEEIQHFGDKSLAGIPTLGTCAGCGSAGCVGAWCLNACIGRQGVKTQYSIIYIGETRSCKILDSERLAVLFRQPEVAYPRADRDYQWLPDQAPKVSWTRLNIAAMLMSKSGVVRPDDYDDHESWALSMADEYLAQRDTDICRDENLSSRQDEE